MNRKVLLNASHANKIASNKSPNKQKVLRKETKNFHEAIEVMYLRQIDEFMVLQHVIRRFKLHHKADFNKLVEFRQKIDGVLQSTLSIGGVKDEWMQDTRAQMLFCCMRFLDSLGNLRQLEVDGMSWALSLLIKDLKKVLANSFLLNVNCFDVEKLAKIVCEFGPSIADMNRRLNYTHFYSLLGLTSFVSGKKLYEQYMNAKFGHHHLRRYIEPSFVNEEGIWMFSSESDLDDDFFTLTHTTCSKLKQSSNNVKIFGGAQNLIMIDGIHLKNYLAILVPTNEAPNNIDDALSEFRAALMQEYIQNRGAYANVSTDEFDNSVFMTQHTHIPFLIKDWDQIQRHIVGLWCWDVACLDNLVSVESAGEIVERGMLDVKKMLKHELPLYSDNTINKYYALTAKIIGTRSQTPLLKATKLDYWVTRSSMTLGTIEKITGDR